MYNTRELVIPEVEVVQCDSDELELTACTVQLLATAFIADDRHDLAQRLLGHLFSADNLKGTPVLRKFIVAPAPLRKVQQFMRTLRDDGDVAKLVEVLEDASATRNDVLAAVDEVWFVDTTPETMARLMLALRPECGAVVQ